MAYVEPKRLNACVEYGGPIHYAWQKDWLTYLLTDEKEYFRGLGHVPTTRADGNKHWEGVRSVQAMHPASPRRLR